MTDDSARLVRSPFIWRQRWWRRRWELPARLLVLTRELDAEHRAETGRPISRDTLRLRLQIGRDRASDLVRAVCAEVAAAAGAALQQQAA
jgi:hypothetical protein